MNIGTHFDYINHVAFISTHTNIGTPHEKANGGEFANSAFSNVPATFASVFLELRLLLTRAKKPELRQGLLVKCIQKLAKPSHRFVGSRRLMLVGGGWQRSIDRLLTVVYPANPFPHNC